MKEVNNVLSKTTFGVNHGLAVRLSIGNILYTKRNATPKLSQNICRKISYL